VHDGSHLGEHLVFVFMFHESIVECVAAGLDVSTDRGSLHDSLPEMQRLLGHMACSLTNVAGTRHKGG